MTVETSEANAEQIKYWNQVAGPKWVSLQGFLDEQIRPLGHLVLERTRLQRGEHVLDVGCGCGDTTLEIARRVAPSGSVTGIDISGPMLERARASARDAGLRDATFEQADAQTAALPAGRFDLLFSRFGVMFFADPPAAFANLRRALKPGGRLAFVCWRALFDNPWMMIPLSALAQQIQLPPPPAPGSPGPFAFADGERVRGILTSAGFTAVELEPVDEVLTVGGDSDLDSTVDFLLQMGPTSAALREAPTADLRKITAAVREALLPHHQDGRLRLGSAAWIVTAER
jgi:SAM-dependent methyltransferase